MKILLINKFLYQNGGSETYIFKVGEELNRHGHDVEYFGMDHPDRCVGNHAGSYTKNMDFHGGSLISKLSYPIKTIYSGEARKKMRQVLDDFKPDVCHLNNFNYQLTPSIILEIVKWGEKTGHNCKIVYTAHDYQLICPNHMLYNPNTHENCEKCLGGHFFNCVKGRCIHGSTARSLIGAAEAYIWNKVKVYKYIDVIICPSRFMKDKLESNPLFRDKTVFFQNFIDISEQTKPERFNKDYILYFGRYSEEKGIRILIKACEVLPNIPFVFAGKGPLEKEVNEVPNIKNVGFVTGKALTELIKGAIFTVYPSEWYENCPLSIMESQELGTPVLGANIGGIPELVDNGENGELFESGNVRDLVLRIEKNFNDRNIVDKYSERCIEKLYDNLEEYCRKLKYVY